MLMLRQLLKLQMRKYGRVGRSGAKGIIFSGAANLEDLR